MKIGRVFSVVGSLGVSLVVGMTIAHLDGGAAAWAIWGIGTGFALASTAIALANGRR